MKLVFVAKTEKDEQLFSDVIDASNFYAEQDPESGYFVFPDEDESLVDELEKEIQAEIDNFYFTSHTLIRGHFECEN